MSGASIVNNPSALADAASGADNPPMSPHDSAIQPEALAYARGLLKPPVRRDAAWPVFGAMGLLAVAALGLAFAMLTAPPPGGQRTSLDRAPAAGEAKP
jgi:hypothetical protein